MREKETTKEEGTTRKQKEGNRKRKIGEEMGAFCRK